MENINEFNFSHQKAVWRWGSNQRNDGWQSQNLTIMLPVSVGLPTIAFNDSNTFNVKLDFSNQAKSRSEIKPATCRTAGRAITTLQAQVLNVAFNGSNRYKLKFNFSHLAKTMSNLPGIKPATRRTASRAINHYATSSDD